jgi:hypothetical protein
MTTSNELQRVEDVVETRARFTLAAAPIMPDAGSHRIRSEYVEEEWLPFIGPLALLVARRMDSILSTQLRFGVEVKNWATRLSVEPIEFERVLERLVRFGLGEWSSDGLHFILHRRWPSVPLAITTPLHRAALTAITD